MLHFLQQRFLLLQKIGDLPLGGATVGDVFDGQENELAGVFLKKHLARIQEHRASSDNRKVALDFEGFHRGVLGRHTFQQQPQLGNIPLAVAQPVDRTAMNVLKLHPEGLVESAVCRDDAQILIEDQERIADRIHDGLGEQTPLIKVYEQRDVGQGQRVCRSGSLSIVQRFHVYPYEKSTLTKSDQRLARDERRLRLSPRFPEFSSATNESCDRHKIRRAEVCADVEKTTLRG